jgi:hypothetical protein
MKSEIMYKWLLLGVPSITTIFISYSPSHTTTCFGLYRPSSGEIYTVVFRSYYAYNGSVFRLFNLLFPNYVMQYIIIKI